MHGVFSICTAADSFCMESPDCISSDCHISSNDTGSCLSHRRTVMRRTMWQTNVGERGKKASVAAAIRTNAHRQHMHTHNAIQRPQIAGMGGEDTNKEQWRSARVRRADHSMAGIVKVEGSHRRT